MEDMKNTDDILVYNDIGQGKIYGIDKWIRFSLGKGMEHSEKILIHGTVKL